MKLLLIPLVIFLSGCLHLPTKEPELPANKPIVFPAALLEECKPLTNVPADTPPNQYETVLLNSMFENIIIYKDCANKQSNSVRVLKELSNNSKIKEVGK